MMPMLSTTGCKFTIIKPTPRHLEALVLVEECHLVIHSMDMIFLAADAVRLGEVKAVKTALTCTVVTMD